MPLVEFPQDGDKFAIEKTINTVGGIGSMVAITLGKYGMDVDFTGAVGEDEQAKRIKELLDSYQVKTQYVETCYTEKTAVSYKIYNSKSNKFTSVSELTNKLYLTKYKYEFIPDAIIMDEKDHDANLAAINNYPNAFLVFIGEKFNKNSQIYCNKCKYVICTMDFASQATGVTDGLNKSKNIVNLFQKFIDLYNANLIIKLDNFDILYCINDEVRLIKNVNKSITNKDYAYYGTLIYFMLNNYDIENSIKLTNKVMLSSKSEINIVDDIPDYKDIENAIKEFNTMNIQNNGIIENVQSNSIEQNSTNKVTQPQGEVIAQPQAVQASQTVQTQVQASPQQVIETQQPQANVAVQPQVATQTQPAVQPQVVQASQPIQTQVQAPTQQQAQPQMVVQPTNNQNVNNNGVNNV